MPRNWRFWETPEEEDTTATTGLAVTVAPGPKKVVAEVIKDGPKMVTMYKDATPVEVPVSEIPKFQNLGFLLHKPEDLPAVAREIGTIANELYPMMMKMIDGVMEDEAIDPDEQGDYHALTKALSLVNEKWAIFSHVLFQNYSVKEG